MCVVAAGVGAAAAGGLASSVGSSLLSGGGGGGGGSSAPTSGGGLGQGIGDILSGGLSTALGIQGLAGGNLNQLQAGAAAANPFGQYASGFVPFLQQLLGQGTGSITQAAGNAYQGETGFFGNIIPNAYVGTNTSAITTPGQISQLQQLTNNPTQLISALQGGGVQTPSGIQALANQNPAALTAGQQFQYGQGLDALNRSLASTGQVGSGNQLAAATQYGQNFASQAYQQNVANTLNAQQSINQTSGVNQGLQNLVNQMGQNQFGNIGSLAQLISGQQLNMQNLQSQQQQNTSTNLQNLLTQLTGINQTAVGNQMNLIGPLLQATQASSSSPATAGGILANLGTANQMSGGNIASGLSGLGSGIGNLLQGINFGGGGGSTPFGVGSVNSGGSFSSGTGDTAGGYNYSAPFTSGVLGGPTGAFSF